MTFYTGESIEILNAATDFDGVTVLTPALITLVQVEVVDATLAIILANTTMIWDPDRSTWFYLWTAPMTAGTYKAKITMTGVDTSLTWAYLTIRVKTKPF